MRRATLIPMTAALGSSAGFAVLGSVSVVLHARAAAAVSVALCGVGLVTAGRLARGLGERRALLADSAMERLAAAALLGAIAWAALPEAPRVAAAALVALVGSYLASYLRAKSVGLGFRQSESAVDRGFLFGATALAIASGYLEAGLWAAATWAIVAAIRRSVEVAGQEEPA